MSNGVYNPLHPYHGDDDTGQVNRFLEPMKEYAKNPNADITEHRKKVLYTTPDNTTSTISLHDYNNVRHLYGTEKEQSILNAIKQKAINASQDFLLNPRDEVKEDVFNETQYELRRRRGEYIAKYLRLAKTKHIKPFGYDTPSITGKTKQNIVEFTCTRNGENNIPTPIVSKASTDFNIFNILNHFDNSQDNNLIHKIFQVLESAQVNILRQYNDQEVNNELLSLIFSHVRDDILTKQKNSMEYFKHLGTNAERWDDTARKQISSAEWTTLNFSLRGTQYTIVYRSAINYIIPTKVKVEHNVKTVHKFALDFTKILKPMHIDLIVRMNRIEFVWTIHEFEKGRHQIYHAGYTSDENTLFRMPGTLEEMTKRYENNDDKYTNPFFNKSTIDIQFFDKSDMSLLNLHTYALRSKIDNLNGDWTAEQDNFKEMSYATDVGYIYKYNHYTIVASGITFPIHHFNATEKETVSSRLVNIIFYTIIHWNNTPIFNPVKTDPAAIIPTNKDLNKRIDELSTYIRNVDTNYTHLMAHRATLPDAAMEKLDFFIPAILFKKSTDVDSKQHQIIGVYFLEKFPREDIEYIRHIFNKEKLKILQEEVKLHIDYANKEYPDQVMITHLKEYGYEKADTKRIETKIGVFGHFLKKLHGFEIGERSYYTDGTPIKTELEIWSDFWHDYFALRPHYSGMYSFEEEDSEKMRIYHTRIQDIRDQKYFHNRRERNHHYQNKLDFSKIHFQKRGNPPRNQGSGNPHQKKAPRPWGFHHGQQSQFTKTTSTSTRLAAAVTCLEFTPQDTTLKMQAEIDSLKRTLNELTLRAAQ